MAKETSKEPEGKIDYSLLAIQTNKFSLGLRRASILDSRLNPQQREMF